MREAMMSTEIQLLATAVYEQYDIEEYGRHLICSLHPACMSVYYLVHIFHPWLSRLLLAPLVRDHSLLLLALVELHCGMFSTIQSAVAAVNAYTHALRFRIHIHVRCLCKSDTPSVSHWDQMHTVLPSCYVTLLCYPYNMIPS